MQVYLQKHPFASGPDAEKNRVARELIKAQLSHAAAGAEPEVLLLKPEETRLPAEVTERLRGMLTQSGVPRAKQDEFLDDFGWEANLVPGMRAAFW